MLKRLAGRLLIASLVIISNFRPLIAHANETPVLLIGEVAWAGSSLSTADEWLELWNTSDTPLELAGYELRGASAEPIVFDTTHILAPKSAFVIANYSASDTKSVLALEPDVVTTTVSLSNNALHIELFAPDGTFVDVAGDGEPTAGTSLPTKSSMIRQSDGSWMNATSSINLDEGVSDLATPGLCDGCVESTEPEPVPEPISEPVTETPTSTEPVIGTSTSTEPVVEISTSTEQLIDPEQPTSTEPVLEPPVGTSTTETIELPVAENPTVIIQNTTPITEPSPPLELFLHAIFPAPESGDEWIEIDAPAGTSPDQANGWSLRDASATIFRFATMNERVTASSTVWRVSLASARLNNGGDTVELVRPDGSVAERMTYPETARGKRWIKNADKTAWVLDPPETVTVIRDEPPAAEVVHRPTLELPFEEAAGDAEARPPIAPQTQSVEDERSAAAAGPAASKKEKTVAKKSTVPKTTAPKKAAAKNISLLSIDMSDLTRIEPETRVTIAGTVATKPGILNKYHFILLAPDGHGLYVRGTSKQPSPAFGAHVRVSGTLSLNDDGLQLKMGTNDRWVPEESDARPVARVVDLLDPATEDAWSLIELRAQVIETKTSEAMLDVDGIPVVLRIRPAAGYRGARLKTGDKVRVAGLIDIRSGDSALFVRSADDIEILAHAALAPAESPATHLPDWTPFGAAGITVAVAEGWKRVRRWRSDRKVQALIAAAHAEPNL